MKPLRPTDIDGKKLSVTLGVLMIALAVMIGLSVFMGRTLEELDRQKEEIRNKIDTGLIFIFVKNKYRKIGGRKTVYLDEPFEAQTVNTLAPAIYQGNRMPVGIKKVYLTVPPNVEIFTGGEKGRFWSPVGRQNAKEVFVVIRETIPPRSSMKLPLVNMVFKTGGTYALRYLIVLENGVTVTDSGNLQVLEREL